LAARRSASQRQKQPPPELPQGPSFFRFSDPAECDRTLREAGFLNVRVTSIPQVWRFNAPGGLFDAIYHGGVRIKAVLRAQSNEALGAIRNAASEATKNFNRRGTIEPPMPAILASRAKAPVSVAVFRRNVLRLLRPARKLTENNADLARRSRAPWFFCAGCEKFGLSIGIVGWGQS
jgi:hypothetical protein